ncbi:MAG: cyclic nucleotide-binding domain-containing protein [Deltaproteobacteria bacterium]|nr:cyclic nucleotide-binding domain-containing protein [Deltaproteobacteria bacterium]
MSPNGEIDVPKGTVLFRQGDPSDSMFVVAAGRVRLTLGGGAEIQEIGTVGPGEFFGEVSLITGGERSASAEVIEDSRLLVIDRDAFHMLLQDDLATVTRMLSEQGVRLSRTNDPIQEGLQRLARVRLIARGLREVGAEMRLPARIPSAALAIVFGTSPDALAGIVREVVGCGGGTWDGETWTIATRGEVDALLGALVTFAG